MKSLIRGISQAGVAIIVLDAETGAFEAGIQSVRQTLIMTKSMGVIQLIFCVNKMDSRFFNHSKDRFAEIKDEITRIAKRAGYIAEPLFIPVSAWNGWNILEPADKFSWFKGPTLLDAINALKPPTYHSEKPLRIPILEVYNLEGVGTVVFGKIESGILKLDTKLRFTNGKKKITDGTVGSIEIFRKSVTEAKAGEMVSIKLENVNYQDLKAGIIISDAENNPAREVVSFEGEIVIVKCPGVIKPSYKPTFHCYTLQTRCKFKQLLETSKMPDRSEKEENPTELRTGRFAVVLFEPDHPFYIEPFETFPPFGRFVIRDNGHVTCVGIVKKVNYETEN